MSQVISILAMIATILIAWGLDNWVNLLKKQALADFSYNPLVWGTVVANLLIAITWVLLASWILRRNPKSKWVSVIYLITGLFISIIVPLQLSVPENYRGLLLFEETRYIRLAIMGVIGLTSRFTLSAAVICILGGISLLLPNKKTRYVILNGVKNPYSFDCIITKVDTNIPNSIGILRFPGSE